MKGLGATEDPKAAMGAGSMGQGEGPLGPEGGAQEASPEEQAVYNRFIALFMMALYDEKMLPKTAEFLSSAPDPVAAVADVASSIAMRTYTDAKERGVEVTGDVLLHAGKDALVPLVVELAESVGLPEFSDEQMEAAFYRAADQFSKSAQQMGDYGEEVRGADLQRLNELADSGQMDDIMAKLQAAQAGGME